MESRDTTPAIVESPSDWEAGTAAIPAGRMDYTRTSQPAPATPAHEDEANSDLGNLGRDVHAEEPALSETH